MRLAGGGRLGAVLRSFVVAAAFAVVSTAAFCACNAKKVGLELVGALDKQGPTTHWYRGRTEILVPSGRKVGEMQLLLERRLEPEHSRIVETLILTSPRAGQRPRELVTTQVVDGGIFTMTEAAGSLQGEGELYGQPWSWSAWSSTARLAEGSRMISRHRFVGSQLASEKEFFDAQDRRTVTLRELYQPISRAEFELEREHLLGGR